jgi:hypothetical protein
MNQAQPHAVDEGIEKFIAWYRDFYNIKKS